MSKRTQTRASAAADTPMPTTTTSRSARAARKAEKAVPALSPDELVRALRAVASELERDPALAGRVAEAMRSDGGPAAESEPADAPEQEPGEAQPPQRRGRSFQPRIVTGTDPRLGAGIPDPFALRERLGAEGLRAALDELRLGTLRAIVREHQLDPKGQLKNLNDDEKYRAVILKAAEKRARS